MRISTQSNMTRHIIVCLAIQWIVFFAAERMVVAEDSRPFVINISTTQSEVRRAGEVRLRISLTNSSGHTIRIGEAVADAQAELDYAISVTDSHGLPAKVKKESMRTPDAL